MRYVLLLRGINVGGNNRVEMARLKALLENIGHTNVITYINSGNVIFDATSVPGRSFIEEQLEKEFGFVIPTLVVSGEDIVRIAKAIPAEWKNDKENEKSDVLYLFEEIDTPEIIDMIGVKPEIETFIYVGGALLTNISRKNQSKGSLQKLVGTKPYKQMTIRNITTAQKLAELVSQ